jgi:hypothetical protein
LKLELFPILDNPKTAADGTRELQAWVHVLACNTSLLGRNTS